MANWVKTHVRMKGKKEELDKLESMMVHKYGGENYEVEQNFFNSLVPIKEFAMSDLREWLEENWGTCTEAEELWYDRHSPELLEIAFETAWNTPLQILKAITKQFPSVVIGGYYADEDLGWNCGVVLSNKDFAEKIIIGCGTKPHQRFASMVWDLNSLEEYGGKLFEKMLGRTFPKELVEVGLGDEK